MAIFGTLMGVLLVLWVAYSLSHPSMCNRCNVVRPRRYSPYCDFCHTYVQIRAYFGMTDAEAAAHAAVGTGRPDPLRMQDHIEHDVLLLAGSTSLTDIASNLDIDVATVRAILGRHGIDSGTVTSETNAGPTQGRSASAVVAPDYRGAGRRR